MIQDYRKTLAEFQPQFWKPAFGASASSTDYFGGLVTREDALCLVAEVGGKAIGFALVTPTLAPPVYDPGGPTVTLDDFASPTAIAGPKSAPPCWRRSERPDADGAGASL